MHLDIVWSNRLLASRHFCDIMHVLNREDKLLLSHNEYNDGDKLYSYCFRSINETKNVFIDLIIDCYFKH